MSGQVLQQPVGPERETWVLLLLLDTDYTTGWHAKRDIISRIN